MKLAVCKIGANITFSSSNKSAANADILYFLRQLDVDDHEVTIHTHKTRNTFIPKRVGFKEISETESFNDYDKVLVFNGSINFFGGAIDLNLLQLYRALRNSDVPIVYINTDGALPMKQLWPSIWKREWAQDFEEDDFFVEPDQVTYVTQGRDVGKMLNMVRQKPDRIIPRRCFHYPLYETILAKHEKYITPNRIAFEDRPYDLGFGGYTRNTYKRKRIEHYYGGHVHHTLLFGNLRGCNTGKAIVRAKCSYQQFINTMKYCRGTIIIGDHFYEDNFFTLRMYESLLADNMVFIDERLDSIHGFWGNHPEMYVNSPDDAVINHKQYLDYQALKYWKLDRYDYKRSKEELEAVLEDA